MEEAGGGGGKRMLLLLVEIVIIYRQYRISSSFQSLKRVNSAGFRLMALNM